MCGMVMSRLYRKGRHSSALRASDCENLILAVEHSRLIGRPLNKFLTIHLDKAGVSNPVAALGKLRKLMSDWLRCNGADFTAVWVREAGGAKGEHVHILLSVPANKIGAFNRRQRSWMAAVGCEWKAGVFRTRSVGGSNSAAFNPASADLYLQAVTATLDYCLKGADLEARGRFGIKRNEPGGELVGKRCGTTENIGRTARGRWVATRAARPRGYPG